MDVSTFFEALRREKCKVLKIYFAKPILKNFMDGVFQETVSKYGFFYFIMKKDLHFLSSPSHDI